MDPTTVPAVIVPLLLSSAALSNPIVNWEREDGFESAVSLGAEFHGEAFSACSGNLITSRIVLSAAHCSADLPTSVLLDMGRVFFGDDVNDADHVMELESVTVHPDYVALESGTSNTGEYDLGVIVLTEDAPIRPTPIRRELWSREELPADIVSVGFGTTNGATGRGSGKKRSADLTVDDMDRMFLYSHSDTNPDNAQICSGDSGGPQFQWWEDQWFQVAVHSWGDGDCEVLSGSTRVDKNEEWILDQIEETHGTRDWCDAAGLYGDGACDDFCEEVDPDCIEDTGVEDGGAGLGCGCAQAPGPIQSAPWLLALLGLVRRRR